MRALGGDASRLRAPAASARSVRMRTNSSKPPGVSADACRGRDGRSPAPRGPAGRGRARRAAPRRGSARASSPATASPRGRDGWSARPAAAGRAAANSAVASATRIRQPPENSLDRPRLRGLVEAEAGEDGGGARGCGVGADGEQPLVDLRQPVAVGGARPRPAGEALGVALPARCPAATLGPHGASCATVADAGAGGEADLAAIQRRSRRRWRAAGWICRRRCGRPGRCGGPGRPSGRRRPAACARRGGW